MITCAAPLSCSLLQCRPTAVQKLAASFLRSDAVQVTIGSHDLAASHSIKQVRGTTGGKGMRTTERKGTRTT